MIGSVYIKTKNKWKKKYTEPRHADRDVLLQCSWYISLVLMSGLINRESEKKVTLVLTYKMSFIDLIELYPFKPGKLEHANSF